jgi:Lectin C-type domain
MKISSTILVTIALASTSTLASAAPVQDPSSGRFYEVVLAPQGISWAAANTGANNATHLGIQGHLATINSADENAFVATLRVQANPPGNRPHLWLGGFQPSSAAEPGSGWQWINGETIAATNTQSPYTNWDLLTQPPQPDNSNNSDFLAMGQGGAWYDSRPQDVFGYVIEFGDQLAPFAAANCKPKCNLTGAVFNGKVDLELPPSANPQGDYAVSTFLIHDPRVALGTCGQDPLPLFPDPALPNAHQVELPPTLCGDPDIVVAKVSAPPGTPFFQITKDIVQVTGATELLQDNEFDCFAPIPPDIDQLHREVAGYQPSQGPILEKLAFKDGVHNPALKGTVAELTNLCGSVRLGGPGRSWYFFGLRYFLPKPPAGFTSQSWLIEVIKFKLDAQLLAIEQAKPALSKGDYSNLKNQTDNAKGDIAKLNFSEAMVHLRNVEKILATAIFKVTGKNDHGEIKARNDNLIFTLNEKLIGAQ